MVVGPRRKPPIIKLMARFGENSWYKFAARTAHESGCSKGQVWRPEALNGCSSAHGSRTAALSESQQNEPKDRHMWRGATKGAIKGAVRYGSCFWSPAKPRNTESMTNSDIFMISWR